MKFPGELPVHRAFLDGLLTMASVLAPRARALWQAFFDTREKPRVRLPEVVQFPVNDICNSRCEMCFIWERKRGFELGEEDVRRVFSDPLFRKVTSVGINGGEPTLRKDLPEIVRALIESLPSLKAISLITNAIQEDRVIGVIQELREITRANRVTFDLMVSLDGVGGIHDVVRGRAGNFVTAAAVLESVKRESLADVIRIGCTLTATNARYGEQLLEWAQDREIYARFRIAVPHNRLYNRDRKDDFFVRPEDAFHILHLIDRLWRDYEGGAHRDFYQSLFGQLAYGAPRTAGCAWRNHGVTVMHDGRLAYCAVESPPLESALEESASEIFERGLPILGQILEDKCAGCLHDYDGPTSFLAESRELIPRRFGLYEGARRLGELVSRARRRAGDITEAGRSALTARVPSSSGGRGDTVVLTGWYGTETIGDQAILGGLLKLVRERHSGPIVVASLEPVITERTLRILGSDEAVGASSYEEAAGQIAKGAARAVAMAGGPLMGPVDAIRQLSEVHRMAAKKGVPAGLLGCGIGPLGNRARRGIITGMLKNSQVVTVRDSDGEDIVRRLSGRNAEVVADPALLWLIEQEAEAIPPGDSAKSVAMSLRSWPIFEYGHGVLTEEHRSRLEQELVEAAIELSSAGWHVDPVSMGYLTLGGDDRRVNRRLLGHDLSDETQLVAFPTPSSVWGQISRSGAVVAMRFHAALFALAAGKNVVAIDYTLGGKLAALARSFPAHVQLFDPRALNGRELKPAVESAARSASPDLTDIAKETRLVLGRAIDELVG